MPIIIFHGDKDNVIYYKSSIKLKELTKPGDILITLPGQGHLGITHNHEYLEELKKILQVSFISSVEKKGNINQINKVNFTIFLKEI